LENKYKMCQRCDGRAWWARTAFMWLKIEFWTWCEDKNCLHNPFNGRNLISCDTIRSSRQAKVRQT
jgi:hypothetical protein